MKLTAMNRFSVTGKVDVIENEKKNFMSCG